MSFKTRLAVGALLAMSLTGALPSLVVQRQASLEATTRHAERYPDSARRCNFSVDARTDIVAFPAGRADRVYIYSYGLGRAYLIRNGEARLVWCGKALYTPEAAKASASHLTGNAARALSYPLHPLSGTLPVEKSGMDIFSNFAGFLTTIRMDEAGKLLRSKERGNPAEGEYCSALQFGARDTCP